MDLQHFVDNFKNDSLIGNAVALYIIASKNLSSQFQRQNFARCGVAGSREQANREDRSVTPSGAPSKASSLMSRCAMYLANNIQSMNLIACLVLPPSVVSGPTGTIITRLLEQRKEGDNRPDYALKGKTVAVYLETLYHNYLDDSPNISRARTARQEWFKTTQSNYQNMKLALQAVGTGIYYDMTKFSPTAMPTDLVGKGKPLKGGAVLDTSTHRFRESPRLQQLRKAIEVGDEVEGEDGIVRLDASDVEDIRRGTTRGMQLLDLITRREKAQATTQTTNTTTGQGTQTAATTTTTGTTPAKPPARTNVATQAPIQVRMTRSAIKALREATNADEEKKRKRLARALGQLSI